jgi:hypothetical protein
MKLTKYSQLKDQEEPKVSKKIQKAKELLESEGYEVNK